MHMLGYPTHFGQMETLKLIAAAGFPEKRIGYLGLMVLLDERHEVLMLVTNSLKNDLNHKNQYIGGLALAALGNICSAEMARDLAPDVERLMESSNPYLRKKAALCAVRVIKKVPDMVESFIERAAGLLTDKNHGVILAGVTLMLQICELDREAIIPVYRRHVPALCKILRSLMQAGNSPEHDIGGITDPFLQVKILRLLRYLGRGNAEASDQMSDILAQVAANVDGARNSGNAILYECVQTIMGVDSISGLRVLAVNILGRFLANKDNNIRYVALNTLSKVVGVSTQSVQRHRATIVECVKDVDVSIRRRALELVYSLVNENNIRHLTKELLDYLAISDNEFKPDLTAKICTLIQRFAPEKRWHIDHMLQVLSQAGLYVKEEVCRAFVVLITNASELHGYAVRSMYRNLHAYQDVADLSLVVTALWCIGEFGEMLLPGAGGALLEGEPALDVSDLDVVVLVENVAKKAARTQPVIREWAVTAAMKLTARLPGQWARLKALVEGYSRSSQLEVQARSVEYSRLFRFEEIRLQLLERMPALDDAMYTNDMASSEGHIAAAAAAADQAAKAGATTTAAAGSGGDLLGLDALSAAANGSGVPATPAAVQVLDDLLGGGSTGLGSSGAGAHPPTAAAPEKASLDALLSGSPTPLPAVAPPTFPSIQAYQHAASGVSVTFAFLKPPGNEALTEIVASYCNTSSTPITQFNLQAAVPKYMQLRLEPATSSTIPPGAGSLGVPAVQQQLFVHNTLHGQKGPIMRLRVSFLDGQGVKVEEQAEVNNFPAGL